MRLTENFILEEFNCKDGTKVPKEYINNVLRLAQELQKLRTYIKEPIIIISGYRTKEYNIRVGGKIQSKHLDATAADIMVRRITARTLGNIIERLIKYKVMKEGGLGIYDTHVHYDTRPFKARW